MSANETNGDINGGVQPAVDENDVEDLEKKELELKRKERDPPIVFQDAINVGLSTSALQPRVTAYLNASSLYIHIM